jgi:hypothetical protein
MRRFVANVVLSLMAGSFLAPIALAVRGSETPACCRRDGKHHCMSGMSGMQTVSTDGLPSLGANSSNCPYRSQAATPAGMVRPQNPAVSKLRLPSSIILPVVDSLLSESCPVARNSERGPPIFCL